jgi:hypothetical protein
MIKVNHLIFFIFSIGILLGQGIPDWVETMTIDDDYYWARENVGIRNLSEDEYKSKAASKALETISMQIRTTISSQSSSSFSEIETESGGSFMSEFDQSSSTATIGDIQGAEKVDEHTTSVTYWVLWRLKKSVHAENMERFVENVLGQYEGFTYIPVDDPVQQLQYLIPAYEDAVKIVGFPVTYERKNLKAEIPNQITSILNSLKLVSNGKTEFTGKVGFALENHLTVQIIPEEKSSIIRDIPIRYEFESGEGTFTNDQVLTSESGKGSTKITKLISRKTVQQVRAKIDLKEWREDPLSKMISFENRLDEMSRANSVLFTIDAAQVTQEKIAIITVGDTTIFSEKDLKRLNRSFRSEFSDVTDFKLKDEALIEGIIETYKRSANLCSNEECQIEIGKKLGVEKLIFIDISGYEKQTDVNIFLRNIAENELEEEQLYPFPHERDMETSEKIQMIYNNLNEMVNDFWIRNNPAYLTIHSNRRNINASFTYQNSTPWMKNQFEERIPLNNKKFFEGDYLVEVDIIGYELYKTNFELSMGSFPEYDIDLIQKTPGRSFWKSFIIPGRGQRYSSDINNKSRKTYGRLFTASWIATTALSVASWSNFIKAKNEYEDANAEYLNQKLFEDVQAFRTIAEEKNNVMLQKQTTAIFLSSLWGTIWIGSAFEAMLNFPKQKKKYSERPSGLKVALNPIKGQITPQLQYDYYWQ